MRPGKLNHGTSGFTFVEVLLSIVVVLVLLAFILPATQRATVRRPGLHCKRNLKQIGFAFRMWAHDHGEKFPMQMTIAEGGTKESASQGIALASFAIISNELSNPKTFQCPEDKKRRLVTDFTQLTAKNLSYFLGLDASGLNPQTILTGDRNICINGQPKNGLVAITNWSAVSWGTKIHNRYGNLGLADGSAHQTTDTLLQKQLRATGLTTNRFAVP